MAKQQEQNFTNTELYPDQICKLYSFKEEKARYRKSYINWDKIDRANKKTNPVRQKSFFLSDKASKLLSIIVAKLQKSERVLLNHKYISTFTLVERRQNVRIIQELEDILDITYHNSVTHNNKKHRFSYEFNYKKHKQENLAVFEDSVGTFLSQQNDFLYIYKENNDIEDIDLESNFLQNSKESICFKKPIKFKKRLSNERKKPTNAELKARVYHFRQYKEPQNLKHHYPLTKEDSGKLQILSGRDFSLNAMNEILLDMSKRRDNQFCSKAQFLAYFGKCLRFEMRDAVKTCNDNFRIKTNIPKEEVKKPKIINEVAVRAYDLENRTTDGFQLLSVAIENLLVKSKAIME
jgi:hypothetical protein